MFKLLLIGRWSSDPQFLLRKTGLGNLRASLQVVFRLTAYRYILAPWTAAGPFGDPAPVLRAQSAPSRSCPSSSASSSSRALITAVSPSASVSKVVVTMPRAHQASTT